MGFLNQLKLDELQALSKETLLKFADDIRMIYDKLPRDLQEDEDIILWKRCFEHYNRPDQRTHIDGPAPPKMYCPVCQQLRKKKMLTSKKLIQTCL